MWLDIVSLSNQINTPWCVLGDFNRVLHLHEISGGKERWTPDIQSFKNCIADVALGHINSVRSFTWINNRPENFIQKRLDRALGNQSWLFQFTEASIIVKPQGLMDHCSLLLHSPMQLLEKYYKPFQFYNYICNLDDFSEVIKKGLVSIVVR